MSLNNHLQTLNIILFSQKFEQDEHEISIVSKVNKTLRTQTKNMHTSQLKKITNFILTP